MEQGSIVIKIQILSFFSSASTGVLTAVNYEVEATVTDNVDPHPVVNYEPTSGADFLFGVTSVTVTAIDFTGNSNEFAFTVTVEDNTVPEIICPTDITVSTTDTLPEVSYEAIVTDNIDPNSIIIYEPESGSEFPIGITEVTVTATDDSGNSSECNFIVTVKEKDIEPDSNQPVQTSRLKRIRIS